MQVKIGDFFLGDLEILRMTLKNDRAPLLRYFEKQQGTSYMLSQALCIIL